MHPRIIARWLLATVLVLGLSTSTVAGETIKIGWTAWSDAEFVTKLAKRILEDRMDYEVELLQTDIAPQYQGLATRSIDIMLMSWQPETHEDYVSPTSRIQRFEDAKPLIGIDPTRKGLHYTGVAASAWVAVIFGGG